MMSDLKLPDEYQPYDNVWVCGNNFNKGHVLFEIEGNAVFLIGRKKDSTDSLVWLNVPKRVGGKPVWVKAIDSSKPIEPGFEVFESPEGNEVSINGMPLLQHKTKDGNLFISIINLIPIGLNIFGGLKELRVSGNIFQNNIFENVHTMVGMSGQNKPADG